MNYSNQGGGQNNRSNTRYEDRKGHQGMNNNGNQGHGGRNNNRGNWNNDHRNDMGGFQNKRRRF